MKFEIPEISPEHRQAIAQALVAYDEVMRINAAIDNQNREIASARALQEDAANALAANDTKLALAMTDSAAELIEKDAKKLEGAVADAAAKADRKVRVSKNLAESLAAAEAKLDAERIALQKVALEHGGAVNRALAEQVAQAAAPMIEAMRMLVVASNATGAYVNQQLSEMLLPDLRGVGYLLHGDSMTALVDGKSVKLAHIDDDPALAELALRVREPRMAFNKLEAYKSRALRTQEQVRADMFTKRGYASKLHD
jgi:hypothetical protein